MRRSAVWSLCSWKIKNKEGVRREIQGVRHRANYIRNYELSRQNFNFSSQGSGAGLREKA
jgi:hypothetical protein